MPAKISNDRDRLADVEGKVSKLEEVVITGNGEVSLKEQVHQSKDWINANLQLPIQTAANTRWIDNANRLSWIVVTILAGIFLEFGCGLIFALMVLLNQAGLLKGP